MSPITLSAWFVGIALSAFATTAAVHEADMATVVEGVEGLERTGRVLSLDGVAFSGRVVEYHVDGELRRSTEYREGMRHGDSNSWYSGGAREWERSYREGREHGKHRGWWEDGSPNFVRTFEDGLQQGTSLSWYEAGSLYQESNFLDGKEEGTQRMYEVDGTLRANYVVKNGRRFGLMGAKGCVGEGTPEEIS